jgi:hypothetical protein
LRWPRPQRNLLNCEHYKKCPVSNDRAFFFYKIEDERNGLIDFHTGELSVPASLLRSEGRGLKVFAFVVVNKVHLTNHLIWMTNDERRDLLELKAFLARAIEQIQEELLPHRW